MKTSAWLLAALAATCPAWTGAQTAPVESPATPVASPVIDEAASVQPGPEPAPATTTAADCCRIAAGTSVELEIAELLSSAARARGDRFAIRLHAPVLQGDTVVIPAGTTGIGEIVHAERSRGGGKPGEMLLAARYLEFNGVQVPLRGLKFGGQGQDKTGAALGASFVLGPFAHFVRGKEIEIPAGTVVSAKLAQEFPISTTTPASPAPAAPAPATPTAAAPAAAAITESTAPLASPNKE